MNYSKGFTLIELLVVLAIIGVLTATAIPAYQQYKKQAYDFRALSDLKMVSLGEESYFLEKEEYFSCSDNTCTQLPGVPSLSKGVSLSVDASSPQEGFTATAQHQNGTGKVYKWDSARGGIVE
jgi:prepilin-type N-terminal cleavage/methylation domain-containing protein